MVEKAEVLRVKTELGHATVKLNSLTLLLTEGGLGDFQVLTRVVAALKGPPAISPENAIQLLRGVRGPPFVNCDDLVTLLRTMGQGSQVVTCAEVVTLLKQCQDTPYRSIPQVTRIIGLLNEPIAMTEPEIRQLRAILRGPPAISLHELEELLGHIGSLEHLKNLLDALEDLRKLCHTQEVLLACNNPATTHTIPPHHL
jgi:hypothetical protein